MMNALPHVPITECRRPSTRRRTPLPDATTPAGRLQMAVLGAIAQFERDRIVERVRACLARAKRKADDSDAGRRGSWINRIAFLSI